MEIVRQNRLRSIVASQLPRAQYPPHHCMQVCRIRGRIRISAHISKAALGSYVPAEAALIPPIAHRCVLVPCLRHLDAVRHRSSRGTEGTSISLPYTCIVMISARVLHDKANHGPLSVIGWYRDAYVGLGKWAGRWSTDYCGAVL
jgi:hypothetical protein